MFKEELLIIRHARSKHNVCDSDDVDDQITKFGETQSRNVGKFMASELDLDGFKFFTSPFLRCLQTSSLIQQEVKAQFQVMHELREYLNHAGRECFVPHRERIFPTLDWSWYPQEGTTYYDEFNEVYLHRMHDAYSKLPQKSVVVTHGLPAFTLMHLAKGNMQSIPIWDHSIDNCSMTLIRRGRVIWHGRNLYHELEYKPKLYHRFSNDGVTRSSEGQTK